MRKDSIFWGCMILNMIALFLLVILKPEVHTLPVSLMTVIIKVDMFLQIGLGFYGIWVSIDPKLFYLFTKLYVILVLIYIVLKIPFLSFLNKYYIVVPDIFSPFPFVLAWIINKAFYLKKNTEQSADNNL